VIWVNGCPQYALPKLNSIKTGFKRAHLGLRNKFRAPRGSGRGFTALTEKTHDKDFHPSPYETLARPSGWLTTNRNELSKNGF
jgi:hypothetical protein